MGSVSPPRGASSALFTPLVIANGALTLKHRIIMSPMTRNRGVPFKEGTPESPNRIWVPDALLATYYGQRANDGGLLITEGILPSLEGGAMPGVPGIWLDEHIAGWKLVTEAVHSKDSYIYAQICHHGRSALPHFSGLPTVSASATLWSTDEKYPYPPPGTKERVMYKDFPPIELSLPHLKQTVQDFVTAARNAISAGFDGVEVHAGNGYLLDQFLSSNVNKRTDKYGGSSEGRCEFIIEVIEEVGKAVGLEKVAVRVSPWGIYQDMADGDRWETWTTLCRLIKERVPGLSYVHFVEAREDEKHGWDKAWGERETGVKWAKEILGSIPVISAGGWDGETCWGAVEVGKVDACVFARWYVSNPDLVERLRHDRPLGMYNRGKFYGPTSKREVGYTDYLTWEEEQKAAKQET